MRLNDSVNYQLTVLLNVRTETSDNSQQNINPCQIRFHKKAICNLGHYIPLREPTLAKVTF